MVVEQLVSFLCFLAVWLFCSFVSIPIVSLVDLSRRCAGGTIATYRDRMESTEPTDDVRLVFDPSSAHRLRPTRDRFVLHRGFDGARSGQRRCFATT